MDILQGHVGYARHNHLDHARRLITSRDALLDHERAALGDLDADLGAIKS